MPTRPIDENPFAAPESDLTPDRYAPGDTSTDYATTWQRFVALFVDGIVFQLLHAAFLMAMSVVRAVVADVPGLRATVSLVYLVVFLLGLFLYHALQESSEAQATLGKRLVGIRVTDVEGRRLSFGRAFGRACTRSLSYVVFGIGFLIQPFTERKQALHDLLAGTIVVRG